MTTDTETEFRDVLETLKGSRPADLPADLDRKARALVEGDDRPTPPWGAFDEHADDVYRYLSALTQGDAWLAEHVLAEAFARVGAKSEPALPELLHAGRHAALESLAKSGPASEGPLSHSDRALVLERRMGLSLEDLARIWSQLPARLSERLTECGASLLMDLEEHVAKADEHADPPCASWRERLPLALLGLLDEAQSEAYAKHLVECAACAQWTDLLEETMTPAEKTLPAPEQTRQRLKERLEPEHCVPVNLGISVSVSCCFCHDGMARKEAAFCATCLAPHHPDCFEAHGRCATPGCPGIDVVYPTQHKGRRKRSWLWPTIGLVGVLIGGAAAWTAAKEARDAGLPFYGLERQAEQQARRALEDNDAPKPDVEPVATPEDIHRPLTFLEDDARVILKAGEYRVGYLSEQWAKAHPEIKTFTVDPQVREVKIKLPESATLDRENFRALLEAHDVVLVAGPGESARVLHRRNVATMVHDPVLVEGDTPVDPDAFVTRMIRIRHGDGQAIFATVRALLTRDTNRIGNILYTVQGATLTIVDFARKVRAYEEMVVKLDRPVEFAIERARVQVFSVTADEWAKLRGKGDRAVLAWLGQSDGGFKTTLCDYDYESPAPPLNTTPIFRREAYRGIPLATPAFHVSVTLDGNAKIALVLELASGETPSRLRCNLPVAKTSVQSIRLEGEGLSSDTYVVFVVSSR